ncbi:MAG: flagellin [Pseudomonadota bacterium]|nr:flagellin [Pseudomonadota bacterium]
MSVVNTNVSASLAQAALAKNERALGTAMEQLSTGSKINSASDDAAGLAMAAKFTAQIKGLDMAVKNASDAISMISTAEGALDEVGTMLQRMRELAVQSSNGTVTAEDRDYMDLEYQALDAEITRIANNTQWNGENVLDGKAGAGGINGEDSSSVTFQISANFTDGTSTTTGAKTAHNGIAAGDYASIDAVEAALNGGGTNGDFVIDTVDGAAHTDGTAALAAGKVYVFKSTAGGDTVEFTANDGDAPETVTDNTVAAQEADAGTTTTTPSNDVITVDFGNLASDMSDVADSDVDTQTSANSAIDTLDLAIKAVNTQRATFGAASNRLEHAVDNMTNIQNNAEASRSRIEDTDYAETTSELAKAQIIAQAGTAMLAQANQSPQSVLSLLR